MLDIVAIPSIVAIVYFVNQTVKSIVANDKFNRWIPLISAGLGGILGVAAFYLCPEIVPVDNVLCALLVGIFSGLSATGTHQTLKQLTSAATKTTQDKTE